MRKLWVDKFPIAKSKVDIDAIKPMKKGHFPSRSAQAPLEGQTKERDTSLRISETEEQGRIHDCSCRGRLGRGNNDLGWGSHALGRGSNDLGLGSNALGRGMLKYKLSHP